MEGANYCISLCSFANSNNAAFFGAGISKTKLIYIIPVFNIGKLTSKKTILILSGAYIYRQKWNYFG